jgi:two-component system, NarL family, sensor kinase
MLSAKQLDEPRVTTTVKAGSRTPGRLAWALAVAAITGALVAVGAGVAYAVVSGDTSKVLSHLTLTPFITIGFAIVGALVAARQPRNPIGWLFLSVGLLYALTALSGVYLSYATALWGNEALLGAGLAQWANNWLWVPAITIPTIFVFLLFPDGRLLSRRWRSVLGLAGLGVATTVLALALHPGPVEQWGTAVNPLGIPAAANALDRLIDIGFWLVMLGFVSAIVSFALRYRRSAGTERKQMTWLMYALAFVGVGIVGSTVIWSVSPVNSLAGELAIASFSLTILGIAVAAGIAILRYRLYDIDLVINRTLVYGTLTVCVVAVYVLVVGGLGALFQAQGSPIIALMATGLVAVAFQPGRERLQRGIDRLFYGERDDPLAALSQLGNRLEVAIAPEMVLPTLVETIAQTLKLPYVAISLRTGDEFKVAAATGNEVAGTTSLMLIYHGETVGQLIAGPRGAGESFSPTDRRLLETIAHQAGPAVRAVQLTTALQHSRLQLVTAREEERRRLRRDLHDGLGATLAALHLQAGVLRRSIRSDPPKAEAKVDEFRTDIRTTIDEIRRLVYELRPPTLDQLGLVAAVRAHATQCSRPADDVVEERAESMLQIRIEAPEELPPLPAAVEVAAFRIAQEALTNVVHHARARHCLIRLELADTLRVEIVDDGVGVAHARETNGGLGRLSMRERAMELGGTCVSEPAPGGGTRVLASLPLTEA